MEQLLALLGVKKITMLVAAFLGAVLSLKFVDGHITWPQRIIMAFGGTFFAVYVSPLISDLIKASESMERALTFLVGLFGLTLASAIFTAIRETKFGEVLSSWIKKPGS